LLTYTFEYGRKAGWATAAGVVSAFIVHISAVALGLTALLLALPNAIDILRYAGIAYLFYLAIKNLRPVRWKENDSRGRPEGLVHFYTRGFIGNLLNPGSMFLYFSLIPQFLHPERGHLLQQNLVLGGLQMLFSFMTNSTIVFFAGYATDSFLQNEQRQQRVRYIMSALIILFAIRMLFIKLD
jgi:threonine/homoserine/homoserine lactone efflux protein